jgi:hypothetical protein
MIDSADFIEECAGDVMDRLAPILQEDYISDRLYESLSEIFAEHLARIALAFQQEKLNEQVMLSARQRSGGRLVRAEENDEG